MQFLNFNEYGLNHLSELNQMWNDEYGFIFPISDQLFLNKTIETPGFLNEASFVAIDGENPVGFITSKIYEHQFKIEAYNGVGWINLIFVKKGYRKKGIGSTLLELATTKLIKKGVKKIYLGKDYQNFFPGLPKDLKIFNDWFIKRGFNGLYETNDLINNHLLKTNLTQLPYHINHNYDIHLLRKDEIDGLRVFFQINFPGRWLVEFEDYLIHGGKGFEFVVCTSGSQIVGFCRIGTSKTPINQSAFSLTWRARFENLGGIGPLGVDKDHRHNNIAYNLIVYAIEELKQRGCQEAIIDWTNLLEFYRLFGFELWKSYTYFEKNI